MTLIPITEFRPLRYFVKKSELRKLASVAYGMNGPITLPKTDTEEFEKFITVFSSSLLWKYAFTNRDAWLEARRWLNEGNERSISCIVETVPSGYYPVYNPDTYEFAVWDSDRINDEMTPDYLISERIELAD